MRPPRLGFFVELDEDDFVALVARQDVRVALRRLGAGVTVGLKDLGARRARAMHALTAAGVPVGAWLLLPERDGYFATYDNVDLVAERLAAFRRWHQEHRLGLASVGLDFEPDLRELRAFFRSPLATLGGWARRARDAERWQRARAGYQALVDELRGDGWQVEAYQFPFLLDDRAGGGTRLQRLAGALDVTVDREVLMAYSSLLGPLGPGLVASWAAQARCLGVGSTGGGVDPLPKLSWEALERDLLVAARHCAEVRIFSLEGCVEHGHLERLLHLDWSRNADVSPLQRAGAFATRRLARLLSGG